MNDVFADIHCAVFDFDGTLAPNLDLASLRREVVKVTQTYAVPAHIYQDQMIVEVITTSQTWLKEHNPEVAELYAAAAHQRILDIELSAAANTNLFDATRPLLAQLRTRGCKTAIVTRNCRAAVLQIFTDALNCCDSLKARDDVTYIKPDPRHVEVALAEAGIAPGKAPGRTMMVGDGKLDMQVGRALNMRCVGVLSGNSDRQALTNAGADVVLDDIAQLLG
jgi:phosphoglycolate phosphatase